MSNIGPLPTSFTPSPSCASYKGWTASILTDGASFLVQGPLATEGCYPSGFNPSKGDYYSPGICPTGYTAACEQAIDNGDVILQKGTCCPAGPSVTYACRTAVDKKHPWQNAFGCVSTITDDLPFPTVAQISDGSTLTNTVPSNTAFSQIWAYGISVRNTMNLNPTTTTRPPPPPPPPSVVTSDNDGPGLGSDRHGLSPETIAGIGVGSCLAVALIIFGTMLLWGRARRSRQAPPGHNSGNLHHAPESSSRTRRKPIPLISPLDSKGSIVESSKHYSPVSIREDAEKSSGPPSYTEGRSRWTVINDISLWEWELLSLLISICSFASIIITLSVYENRLLAEWKLPISINTVISILSAVFKGSLALPVTEGISQLKWLWFAQRPQSLADMDLYDKASRGVWGSAVMIYKQFTRGPKSSTSYLASYGAVLALVTLAVDSFSQASVSPQNRMRVVDNFASIPYANSYIGNTENAAPIYAVNFIDNSMQLATYFGILDPPVNSSVSVPVSCSSGNCTFPADQGVTFKSLTMCSKAWDISDQVFSYETKLSWRYALKSDKRLDMAVNDLLQSSFVAPPETSVNIDGGGPWNRTSIVDVSIMAMVVDKSTNCVLPNCTTINQFVGNFRPAAFKFSLFPCVQTFAANFTNGRYKEEVLAEEYLHWIENSGFQLAVNQTMYNGAMKNCTGTDTQTATNTILVYGPESQKDAVRNQKKPSGPWYPPECVFRMDLVPAISLGPFIGGNFFDNVIRGNGLSAWTSKLWRNGTTDINLVANFSSGLATAIGAQMRKNSAGPEILREVRGETWQIKTFINVQWKYLSFLAAVLGLELLFFAAVMITNHRSPWDENWKSSTLAVAFQNVGDARGVGGSTTSESESELYEAAKSIKVLFSEVKGRWQLREEPGSF